MKEEEYLDNEQRQDPLEGFNLVLLDNYFASRSPEPKKGITGDSYTPEYKTTEDIYDDLEPINPVPTRLIVLYLRNHDYRLKTVADGTLRWEIWRDMRFIE